MLLSDFFLSEYVVRNSVISCTMFPSSAVLGSVCYATKEMVIEKANENVHIVAIITTPELGKLVANHKGLVIGAQPEKMYFQLHNFMVANNMLHLIESPFISPEASIASTAIIGKSVQIHAGVEIASNAQIEDGTIIGAGTYIGPNVIIGAAGMQNLQVDGKSFKINYAGGVKIGADCQILANAIIQKPYQAFYTEIGNETKISVKVSVGHGGRIGNNVMVAGNCTIAGNVSIGDHVWIGPSSTIGDGLRIGNNVKIMIGSVVVNNLPDYAEVSGNFAVNHLKNLKNYAKIKKL